LRKTIKVLCLLTSKSAITRIEAIAVIILIVIVAAAGGAFILSITKPSRNGSVISPITTPTPAPDSPTPTPMPSLTPTPTHSPTSTPTTTPKPSQTAAPTTQPTPTPSPTPIPKYSLSEAIAAGYVEANITGKMGLITIFGGVSSGDSIILNIKRLVNYTIEIEAIPTGTLLVAGSGDTQNMAVLNLQGLVKTESTYAVRDRIILDTPNSVQYLFSGYCVNFNRNNPTTSTLFTPSGLADANVLKIYSILNQLPSNVTGIAAIQTAVFVVTDNVSRAELQSRFPSGVPEIQNAKLILEKAGIDISNAKLFT
jgi:hypothetical protein